MYLKLEVFVIVVLSPTSKLINKISSSFIKEIADYKSPLISSFNSQFKVYEVSLILLIMQLDSV